jgi:hypothetical protein
MATRRCPADIDLAVGQRVNQIIGTSSGGFSFNNTVSSPTFGPPSPVNFVSVGSDLITNYGLAGGGNAPGGAHFGPGFDVVKVFAVFTKSPSGKRAFA